MRLVMGSCALIPSGRAELTGDEQVCRRPCGGLARSLSELGADVFSARDNDCAPFMVRGRLRGGETVLEAVTSQFLTSLLLACPLADEDSIIKLSVLNEKPYVEITLDWLRRLDIEFECDDEMTEFRIPGGQQFKPFTRRIPADFSSATFFLCAGALQGGDVTVKGLDLSDPQGDKAVIDYLKQMGADVEISDDAVRVRPGIGLRGCEIDMNATPDALPMMAALACFAEGQTRLVNVPQARLKETDRIAVMAGELGKMGAKTEELPDGLIIDGGSLKGAALNGHGDHRVVMSLAVAASAAQGESTINTAESVGVTFPTFVEDMINLGARIELSNAD